MRRVFYLSLFLLACAVPVLAQDPVKVDANHYKVEIENAQVRVLRVKVGAGEKSVMHKHPNAVAIFQTNGRVKFTFPDGKSEERDIVAGSTLWTPAITHLPENVGSNEFEVVLVELKPRRAMRRSGGQDPVKVDANHYKVESENASVRVLRVKVGAGEKSVMHRHPNAVAIFQTNGRVKFTFPDGKTEERDIVAGTTLWTPAITHLPENIGSAAFEVVLVELK
jgi:quercetin dioxygenase-like cupin family protein